MKIGFAKPELPKKGALVVGVMEDRKFGAVAADLDLRTGGALTRALEASRFTGKAHKTLLILAPYGVDASRILLYGMGKPEDMAPGWAEEMGGNVYAALAGSGDTEATIWLEAAEGKSEALAIAAAHAGYGALLRSYRFDKYRTKEKADDKPTLKKLTVLVEQASTAKKLFADLEAVAEGVFLTRDVVSEPGNIIYPETLAAVAEGLSELGVEVQVLGQKEMKKLGMGALLGVAQGSVREPKMVIMQWKGAPKSKEPPLAFIGKGVTFDTGGISIKPAGGMEEMKWDMGGSGTVIGLMKALAGRKAKANVIGIVGLVENMPDGNAQRPGDIVTSMSGQTIEVINTDAEGRLVLADCLWYCQDRFKPRFMIDLATLTGAIIVALGHEHAGMFTGDDGLADQLSACGREMGETVWRMPLGDAYDKELNTDSADMKNVGGRPGGSVTAAMFLKRFTNDVPWVHLDIAGVAWAYKDKPIVPKGASGFGVRLLDRLVAAHYES
ncbi:MAG: leucyl aminopeptidase [Alphaproteobacteria bacterium]|nr:leucyl aminopeptidase [Alphaproteobacteria bacterium]MBU0796671.1 leucyl aminopeptidase [Alphaproteobacteria bacterium]MBU0888220.1 leucyl aminopeptidase [Alphaproteobacteria bacterium]MBU1811421.1 leucyl aminopeptidase [Alphaproteobacteria bacterium]